MTSIDGKCQDSVIFWFGDMQVFAFYIFLNVFNVKNVHF